MPTGNRARAREYFWVIAPLVLLIAGAFWLALQFVQPAPPRALTMSTGGESGGYHAFGKRYAAAMKTAGVTLTLKTSGGSIENIARLNDPASDVSLALVQGGTATKEAAADLVSLGRVFLEPLWVFYRSPDTVDRLAHFKGKRIAIGPEGSGTRPLALAMLKLNGIDADSAVLLPIAGDAAAKALESGDADAIFLALAPQSPLVQNLLRNQTLKLMSFAQAEAYARLLPYLSRVTLPAGVIDLVNNIPARDVDMLAPSTALVARASLHPALVALLVEAAKDIHGSGGLFQRIGDFPRAIDPEFELSSDAERYYRNGPPFLQRYLPFWLATFIERMAVMVLPIATVLLPLMKIGPIVYRWSIKRRIFFWYDRLKRLEDRVRADIHGEHRVAHSNEILDIDEAVGTIPVPLAYADQLYSLRAAIDLVRQKLSSRMPRPVDA